MEFPHFTRCHIVGVWVIFVGHLITEFDRSDPFALHVDVFGQFQTRRTETVPFKNELVIPVAQCFVQIPLTLKFRDLLLVIVVVRDGDGFERRRFVYDILLCLLVAHCGDQ